MRYGTAKSAGPWSMTIQLRSEPRCPGCAEFLQPVIVVVRDGWAWCHVCVTQGLNRQVHIAWIVQQDAMWQCSTILNGIRFYTPETIGGKALSAYEWYERAVAERNPDDVNSEPIPDLPEGTQDEHGVYALTPSGEHAIADLDTSDLEQVERDLKSVRSCNGD